MMSLLENSNGLAIFLLRKSRHTVYFHPIKQITLPLPHKHPHDIPKGLLHKLIKEIKNSLEEFIHL